MAAGIEALIPGLEKLDASVTHANASAKELAAGLRGVGGSAAAIGRAADNMERLRSAIAAVNQSGSARNIDTALPAVGIDAAIPGIERLTKLAGRAEAEVRGLVAGLRGVGDTASGIGRTADSMDKLRAAMAAANGAPRAGHFGGNMPMVEAPHLAPGPRSGGDGASGIHPPNDNSMPHMPPNFTMLSNGALVPYTGPAKAWEPTGMAPYYHPNFTMPSEADGDAPFHAEGERRPGIPLSPNGRGRQGEREGARRGAGGHMPAAFDAIIPALLTGDVMKSIFAASFDVGSKEADLLTNGWTPEQVAKARTLAQAVQVSTPGATIGGGLEILKDIAVIFRRSDGSPDVDTATSALPAMMRDALVLASRGHADALTEVFRAVQAGDLKGEALRPGTDQTDPARLAAFVQREVMASVITGNRVTPAMLLQNLRTGGVSTAMMDDKDFFGANLALIEGLGSQAASALGGFNRQFGAGRMGRGVATELEGVFPTLAGHWHSVGMGQVMVDPGAMGDATQLSQHPFQFIHDTLMPGIDKLIRARTPGFDAMPADQRLVLETQEGSRIASSVTGGKAIAEVMRLYGQMERYQIAFEKYKGTDPYAIQAANNPEFKAKGLSAAYNAFEVSLGEAGQEPAIAALNAITAWLNNMAAWAKANPDGAKIALEGLAGGIALFGVTAVAGVAMAALANPVTGFVALAAGLVAVAKVLPDTTAAILRFATLDPFVGAGTPEQQQYFKDHPLQQGPHVGIWGNNPDGTPKTFGQSLHSLAHPEAYHPEGGAAGPTIQHITYIHLDDREIARAVTKQQLRMMGGQVSGSLRPDPSIAPQYGAHLVET